MHMIVMLLIILCTGNQWMGAMELQDDSLSKKAKALLQQVNESGSDTQRRVASLFIAKKIDEKKFKSEIAKCRKEEKKHREDEAENLRQFTREKKVQDALAMLYNAVAKGPEAIGRAFGEIDKLRDLYRWNERRLFYTDFYCSAIFGKLLDCVLADCKGSSCVATIKAIQKKYNLKSCVSHDKDYSKKIINDNPYVLDAFLKLGTKFYSSEWKNEDDICITLIYRKNGLALKVVFENYPSLLTKKNLYCIAINSSIDTLSIIAPLYGNLPKEYPDLPKVIMEGARYTDQKIERLKWASEKGFKLEPSMIALMNDENTKKSSV